MNRCTHFEARGRQPANVARLATVYHRSFTREIACNCVTPNRCECRFFFLLFFLRFLTATTIRTIMHKYGTRRAASVILSIFVFLAMRWFSECRGFGMAKRHHRDELTTEDDDDDDYFTHVFRTLSIQSTVRASDDVFGGGAKCFGN